MDWTSRGNMSRWPKKQSQHFLILLSEGTERSYCWTCQYQCQLDFLSKLYNRPAIFLFDWLGSWNSGPFSSQQSCRQIRPTNVPERCDQRRGFDFIQGIIIWHQLLFCGEKQKLKERLVLLQAQFEESERRRLVLLRFNILPFFFPLQTKQTSSGSNDKCF